MRPPTRPSAAAPRCCASWRRRSGFECEDVHEGGNVMSAPWLAGFLSARVYDLEQPRFAGMPIHPTHKPGYFYALHRRHRDTYQPQVHGTRSGASGVVTMMEHSGTHIDALCHQAHCLTLFGGIPTNDAETPYGFTQLG